jgi:alkylation response protein AidB-like acyl-CoA dehydrogenase
VNLDFTAEQILLRETTRALCAKACGPAVVRRLENDEVGYDAAFWRQVAATGLTEPMSTLDGVVVYEEFGRALAPSPHFVSAVLGAGVLRVAGSPAQREAWLSGIVAGEKVLSVAWLEPDRGFGPAGVASTVDSRGRVTGTKWHVPFAATADRLLTLARTAAGVGLFLVDPKAATVTPQRTLSGESAFAVRFDGVPAEPVGPADAWHIWSAVLDAGLILLAARAAGGARRALEMAVEHAKTRHQFGKPLGAFQAIGHYLADAATVVDGVQTLVWEAAWALDNGRPVDRLAPMAKLAAGNAFRDVTAVAQQIFGGVGFTVDYDIQLYFRRAKQWQLSWCDPRELERRIADAVLPA